MKMRNRTVDEDKRRPMDLSMSYTGGRSPPVQLCSKLHCLWLIFFNCFVWHLHLLIFIFFNFLFDIFIFLLLHLLQAQVKFLRSLHMLPGSNWKSLSAGTLHPGRRTYDAIWIINMVFVIRTTRNMLIMIWIISMFVTRITKNKKRTSFWIINISL